MNTKKAVALGWRPCPECDGEGLEWHGKVDVTCYACRGRQEMLCPECRRERVRLGHERCHTCEHGRAA